MMEERSSQETGAEGLQNKTGSANKCKLNSLKENVKCTQRRFTSVLKNWEKIALKCY